MTTESLKQTPASDPAATGRAYSFTIEVTPDGKRAVVITEVRQVDDRYERHCVVVGESELAGFIGGLQAAAGTLRPEAEPSRAYSVRDVRGQHPKAYAAWSPADDQRLLARHRQGASVAELAREFGRRAGAIESRLVRLGAGVPQALLVAKPTGVTDKPARPV